MKKFDNVCSVCGTVLKGRLDKKYCSDQCRYIANNEKKRKTDRAIITVNSILRKNRKILKSLNPEGRSTIRKEFMKQAGFNFKYFTSYYKTKSGNLYFFCYEYGYMQVTDKENIERVVIINYQDYMDKFTPDDIPAFKELL